MKTPITSLSSPFDIICFSCAYWDESSWTDQHYHMRILSQQAHRVLYIEPGLSILGCLYGWRRLKNPWKRLIPSIKRIYPHLYLFYIPVLPGGANFRVLEKINLMLLKGVLKYILRILRFHTPLFWVYHPQYIAILKTLHPSLICYDCVDEFAEYPNVVKRKQQIFQQEQELIREADLVFTTSPHLYSTRKKLNSSTYYLPNAAEVEHFSKALSQETVIPQDFMHISSPIIGFVGAVSTYKLDIPLLRFMADAHPEWHIVLIGPIGEGEENTDMSELQHCQNVHILGSRSYATLPDYLKKFDVCMIPYHINQYTQGVFPMKFYEYMATGKPIVTTALPSLLEFESLVRIAHSHEEFVSAVEQVLQHDPNREARLQEVQGHTWEARTRQIMDLITERLAEKNKISNNRDKIG